MNSPQCASVSNRDYRRCYCGTEFEAKNKNHRYCSDKCRSRLHLAVLNIQYWRKVGRTQDWMERNISLYGSITKQAYLLALAESKK